MLRMNVASLELCKELYELSGWQTENNYHMHFDTPVVLSASVNQDGTFYEAGVCPAYGLGYVLRKLPTHSFLENGDDGAWLASWNPADSKGYEYKEGGYGYLSYTPESAVCKLAIELFKQGILKRDDPQADTAGR